MQSTIDRYVRDLRKGLRGLPRPDVDDILEEIRSHVAERVSEGRTPEEATAGLGAACDVAREIVQKRVHPEAGPIVPDAPTSRKIIAWCADFLVGGVLLLLNPAWFVVLGWIQTTYWMTYGDQMKLATMPGGEAVGSGVGWAALALLVGAGWAAYYWLYLRRGKSASVGMRMTGISRLTTPDGVRILRTADIAQGEPACMVARPKWYLAVPVVPIGLLAALVMLELTVMTVGSFLQPFNPVLAVASDQGELLDSQEVVEAFYDEVVAGDADGAAVFVSEAATFDTQQFIADRDADGLVSAEISMGVPPDRWYVVETLVSGKQREVLVTIEHAEKEIAPGDYVVSYRILRCSDTPLGDSQIDVE